MPEQKIKSHGVWRKSPHGLFNLVHNEQCFETLCVSDTNT